jgi:hypothetical protein
MDIQLILDNLLQPPILFFALGMLAVAMRSSLEIPEPLTKLFSLYLLLAIGFKGGVKLASGGLDIGALHAVLAGLILATVVPIYVFFTVRQKIDVPTSAAVAATYGSVSAVTFLTTMTFITRLELEFGGYMVAVMALMELPAIILGVILYRKFMPGTQGEQVRKRDLFHESITNSSVFLLLGSMMVGVLSGSRGWEAISPFTDNLFQGMLCFFLLDLGMVAARRMEDLAKTGLFLVVSAVVIPLCNGLLGLLLARALELAHGDAVLLCILAGSASYIAVPAAMRQAIPEANHGTYVSMALAVTFPFNLAFGIPLYTWAVTSWWPG